MSHRITLPITVIFKLQIVNIFSINSGKSFSLQQVKGQHSILRSRTAELQSEIQRLQTETQLAVENNQHYTTLSKV